MSSQERRVGVDLGMTDQEKQELRNIARTVLENKAREKPVPEFSPAAEKLCEMRGAFVTIYKRGMLRGCIGCLEADRPVYKTVVEMAEAAAFYDPRFRPITEEELPYLDFEISVLTPLERIHDASQVKVGLHGIMIRKGRCCGLLLPQVATERNWDTKTFLEETCRKAGLPMDTWKDKETEIYIFSADVF